MSFDVLFFEVRGRRCALPVAVVREVLATPTVTPVPLTPPLLRGLVPVRGQVLPLIDVGAQLGVPGGDSSEPARLVPTKQDRIVVVETPAGSGPAGPPLPLARARPAFSRLAFAASRISRLGSIHEGHSRPPPPLPRFVSATVFDVEGPALLLDAALAMETLRSCLGRGGVA
jgi:chemotaxis signal transduction protein